MKRKVIISLLICLVVAGSLLGLVGCDNGTFVYNEMSIKLSSGDKATLKLDFATDGVIVKYEGKAEYTIDKKADSNGNRKMTFKWKDKDKKDYTMNVNAVMDKNGNIVIADLFVFKKA